MHDWHLAPDHINNFWTEEMLVLFMVKRAKRIQRENDRNAQVQQQAQGGQPVQVVTDAQALQDLGIQPEVINVNQSR